MAIAPLSLLYATSRAWSGQGDHVAAPLTRVLVAAIGALSYTWLWAQLVALSNQITNAILDVHAVSADPRWRRRPQAVLRTRHGLRGLRSLPVTCRSDLSAALTGRSSCSSTPTRNPGGPS
jgi:hypothetical protein